MSAEHDELAHGSHGPRKILSACREIMKGDPGIQSELEFAWQMSWILLLKLLDERERTSHGHESIVPSPYRWRDWAVDPAGATGNELLDFLESEDVELAGGRRGPGLFPALRALQGGEGGDVRDVIAQTFTAARNRMVDGYLLRDVLAQVDRIHFSSPQRAKQAADAFEELLEDVREAWVGEPTLHTPRALVDLLVRVLRPRAHEVLLDPACGDGGFLRAAHAATVSDPARTGDPSPRVARIEGSEPNPLAYVLGVTNLLLHGVENPAVYNEDPLSVRLSESGVEHGVDVILGTLPSGTVEPGVASAFPRDLRTSDATLLHLLLALRRLRRAGHGATSRGRAAVIVPDHVLSTDGAGPGIRARLLEESNLHTIVRLPPGVFAPAFEGATSILFFERGKPTREIWYYAHPLPEHRRHVKDPRYTRSRQLHFEEFSPLLEWWDRRVENEFAWKVPVNDVLEYDEHGEVAHCDLDRTRVAFTPEERARFAERAEDERLAALEPREPAPKTNEALALRPTPPEPVAPFLELPLTASAAASEPAESPTVAPAETPPPAPSSTVLDVPNVLYMPMRASELRETQPMLALPEHIEELGELEELRSVASHVAEPAPEPDSLPWPRDESTDFDFAPPEEIAAPSRVSSPSEPDELVRVTIPPVIDRPDLMGPGRRAASSALFLFTWILWVFVWLPLLTALAWYLGFLHFRDQVWDEGLDSLFSFLRFYGSVVGIALLVLLLWSLYNGWRFGGRQNRRHSGAPLAQDQLARDFGIAPELLERIQSSRVLWIDVGPSGSIVDSRTRPMSWHHEPASEAWNNPEGREMLEKTIADETHDARSLEPGPFDAGVDDSESARRETQRGGASAPDANVPRRRDL